MSSHRMSKAEQSIDTYGSMKAEQSIDTYGNMKAERIVTRDKAEDRQVLATMLSDVRGLGDEDSGNRRGYTQSA